jgi:hypothetical protein
MLLLSLGLGWAAESISRQTTLMIDAGQVHWTREAEEMAKLLDANGQGRRYVALHLAMGDYIDLSRPAFHAGDAIGGMQ